MISANCLVFPKPQLLDASVIEKNLVYIPKDTTKKHFYTHQPTHDDLLSTATPTSRGDTEFKYKFCQFKIISLKLHKKNVNGFIPCVFLKGTYYENKLIIYFHSNAEDIISAYPFAKSICNSSGRSVLMMEYSGYSIYRKNENLEYSLKNKKNQQFKFSNLQNSSETTAQDIQNDAKKVLQYMKDVVGYNLNDITIMGRSIGSGPAVYLASIYPVGSLILLSPFLSIQEAVRDLYGEICSRLIKQRFNNKQRIKFVESPTLIIHGLQDNIIPYNHSVLLTKQIKSFSALKLVQKMKHNSFNFHRDFVTHVKQFLRKIQKLQFRINELFN